MQHTSIPVHISVELILCVPQGRQGKEYINKNVSLFFFSFLFFK